MIEQYKNVLRRANTINYIDHYLETSGSGHVWRTFNLVRFQSNMRSDNIDQYTAYIKLLMYMGPNITRWHKLSVISSSACDTTDMSCQVLGVFKKFVAPTMKQQRYIR